MMTKKIKSGELLELMALLTLPEPAMIRRLAAYKLRQKQAFTIEDARILVRTLMPARGDLERLACAIRHEYLNQYEAHKTRLGARLAKELAERPISVRMNTPEKRKVAHQKFAIRQFGDYVKGAFADDVIALLELLKHEHRLYEVIWVTGGVRPVISALLKVTVTGEKKAWSTGFLLYKAPGQSTIRAATCPSHLTTLRDAWAWQVPDEILDLRKEGWAIKTDFEAQTLTATGAGGELVVSWEGASGECAGGGEAK